MNKTYSSTLFGFGLKSGIANAISSLVLNLFREPIEILFRQDGAIRFQFLKTILNSIVVFCVQTQASLVS